MALRLFYVRNDEKQLKIKQMPCGNCEPVHSLLLKLSYSFVQFIMRNKDGGRRRNNKNLTLQFSFLHAFCMAKLTKHCEFSEIVKSNLSTQRLQQFLYLIHKHISHISVVSQKVQSVISLMFFSLSDSTSFVDIVFGVIFSFFFVNFCHDRVRIS